MVFVPATYVEGVLDLPTPWAQRPNSLASDVVEFVMPIQQFVNVLSGASDGVVYMACCWIMV